METKEYTDYLITVWGSGERAFKDMHIRFIKPKEKGNGNSRLVSCVDFQKELVLATNTRLPAIKDNGFKYKFDTVMNWAFKTKFTPWSKVDFAHPIGSLVELVRTKRIGHLHYREPCNHECKSCAKFKDLYPNCHPQLIEPIHFSKVRQPSGRNITDPIEMVQDPYYPEDHSKLVVSRVEVVTPKMLKDRVDNKFYRAQFGSYKYGVMRKIGSKWLMVMMVGGVVGFVMILYFTGNLPI